MFTKLALWIALALSSMSFVVNGSHTIENALYAPSDSEPKALPDHAALTVDFTEVFRSARTEPQLALAKLSSNYGGRELGAEEATKYFGYEPALFERVPEEFTRVSTYVLNMPCCKCSATSCERSDGTSFIVFEHRDVQPVWFGASPSIETQCLGMPCGIVESAGQQAFTKHPLRSSHSFPLFLIEGV